MFEFALSEMLLIGVVALVVLGPQRLPKVARTVGLWVGKIQYFVSNVKTDLSRHGEASELREVKESLESAARGLQDNLRDMDATARQEAKEIADGLNVPAWERLPEQKTPADFGVDEWGQPLPNRDVGVAMGHMVSLQRQAMLRRRDMRPRFRAKPMLRVRRHQGGV